VKVKWRANERRWRQLAAIGVVALFGAAGCVAGLLTDPDEEWMTVVYLGGLAYAAVSAVALAKAARIRRQAISEVMRRAQEVEMRFYETATAVRGEERPWIVAESAVRLLPVLREAHWQLMDLRANREADALTQAVRELLLFSQLPYPARY
jgi:hypothetical protein